MSRIKVVNFEDVCTLIHVFETIDDNTTDQLKNAAKQAEPKIVINFEFVSFSSANNLTNFLIQMREFCMNRGGDLVIANPPRILREEITRDDKQKRLLIASGLDNATRYFKTENLADDVYWSQYFK